MLSHYLNRRRLGAYLDGALDDGMARSTAAHLATCGVCQREAEGLRRLRALLRSNLAVTEPDWTGFWQFGPGGGAQPDGVIVRSASTGDPGATVMVYGTPERDVAVVWVLGLDAK